MAADWLDKHIEEFIRPRLGKVPELDKDAYPLHGGAWIPLDVKCLQAMWWQGKRLAKGRTILLPGRDAFLLEVLARLEDWPTIFDQRLSSVVCRAIADGKYKGIDISKFKDCFAIDTGYRGSVPKALGVTDFALLKYHPDVPLTRNTKPGNINVYDPKVLTHQIFPYMKPEWWEYYDKTGKAITPVFHKGARLTRMAGQLEGAWKYWTSASVHPTTQVFTQEVMPDEQHLTGAFRLTRFVAETAYPPKVKVFLTPTRRSVIRRWVYKRVA
jgi:hypothetical protein